MNPGRVLIVQGYHVLVVYFLSNFINPPNLTNKSLVVLVRPQQKQHLQFLDHADGPVFLHHQLFHDCSRRRRGSVLEWFGFFFDDFGKFAGGPDGFAEYFEVVCKFVGKFIDF